MSRAGYLDKTPNSLSLGTAFQFNNKDNKWWYSLVVDHYHRLGSETYATEKLATEAMHKAFNDRNSNTVA